MTRVLINFFNKHLPLNKYQLNLAYYDTSNDSIISCLQHETNLKLSFGDKK